MGTADRYRRGEKHYQELHKRYQSRGRFRRPELAAFLERLGFVPETERTDAHARWRWDDPQGQQSPVTVGIAGHGASPEVDFVYVKKVLEAARTVLDSHAAYIEQAQAEQRPVIEEALPDYTSREAQAGHDLFHDYIVVQKGGRLCVRHPLHPEIGVTIPAGLPVEQVDQALRGLDKAAEAYETRLKKLEADYGYIAVQDPRNPRLVNPGYELPEIDLPLFGEGKFFGERKAEALSPEEETMRELYHRLDQAEAGGKAVQDDILQTLHNLEMLGYEVRSSELEDGSIRHELVLNEARGKQERQLRQLKRGKFAESVDRAMRHDEHHLVQSYTGAQISASSARKLLTVAQRAEDGAWAWDMIEREGRAPLMDSNSLNYLKSLVDQEMARTQLNVAHLKKDDYLSVTEDPKSGTVSYASTLSGLRLMLDNAQDKISRTAALSALFREDDLLMLKNIRCNVILKEMELEHPAFKKGDAAYHYILPNDKGALIFEHPELENPQAKANESNYRKLTVKVPGATAENREHRREALIEAKQRAVSIAMGRMASRLLKEGYTMQDITEPQGEEISHAYRLRHSESGHEVRIPAIRFYDNNAPEVMRAYKAALSHARGLHTTNRVEALIDEMQTQYGCTVERTPLGTAEQITIRPPVTLPDAKAIQFNTGFAKRVDAVFAEKGDAAKLRQSLAQAGERAQRAKEALIAQGYQLHNGDGRLRVTGPDGDEAAAELPVYGETQWLAPPDLKMLEQLAGITHAPRGAQQGRRAGR